MAKIYLFTPKPQNKFYSTQANLALKPDIEELSNGLKRATCDLRPATQSYVTDTDEYGELISITLQSSDFSLQSYYYLYDGIGQIVALADESGKIVVSYEYDSWPLHPLLPLQN